MRAKQRHVVKPLGWLMGVSMIAGGLGWAHVQAGGGPVDDKPAAANEAAASIPRSETDRPADSGRKTKKLSPLQANTAVAASSSTPTTRDGVPFARITSAIPFEPAPGPSAGGIASVGGACTCDDDCGPPSGTCKVAQCNQETGTCEEINAIFGTRCDSGDGLFCTHDRCDGVGNCVANALSPCAHECVGGPNDGDDCVIAADCPGVGVCTPQATCFEPNIGLGENIGHCELSPDVGRCCLPDDTCGDPAGTHITKAACDGLGGRWLRTSNPDDLDVCVCPKYSAGIAPRDADLTTASPIGPVTRHPGQCSVDESFCEDAALDCSKLCSAGNPVPCLFEADCGGNGLCDFLQTCDANPNACDGLLSVGDDYHLSDNDSFLRLREFRFRGGVRNANEILVFEFYDSEKCVGGANAGAYCAQNADCNSNVCGAPILANSFAIRFGNGGNFYYTFEVDCDPDCDVSEDEEPRDPPFRIPPRGYVVIRSDRDNTDIDNVDEFAEGFWLTADAVNEGTNNADILWIDGNPRVNHLGSGNNRLAFEIMGEKIPSPLGACCDPDNPANCSDTQQWECRTCKGGPFDGQPCKATRDCGGVAFGTCNSADWQGQRRDDDPPALLCADEPCDLGACCDPDFPNDGCDRIDQDICVNGGGTFLGAGTDCSVNCCPQPVPTGGDCCEDTLLCDDGSGPCAVLNDPCGAGGLGTCTLCAGPTIHSVSVPAYDPVNDPNVYITMSGDSTSALFAAPEGDDCAQGANDPGHYEAVEVDACAVITVDLCCNAPVHSPTWIILRDGCPCATGSNIFPDTGTAGFGAPEGPCDDGNWSGEFTVRPGTYWFQIYAGKACENTVTDCDSAADCNPGVQCVDNAGPYQAHFTVRPCPLAACCVIDSETCEPFVDVYACEDPIAEGGLEGNWLGDLDPTPDPSCFPGPAGTCDLGACCTGPGQCIDGLNGAGITLNECVNVNQGVYHGGLRCVDDPCPICPFQDKDHCQEDDPDGFLQASDRRLNRRLADDFQPQSPDIDRVCWRFGFAPPQNPPGLPACFEDPPEDFDIKFYEDDFGQPGVEIASYIGIVPDAKGNIPGFVTYDYSAPLVPALSSLNTNGCYWIEITSEGTEVCTTSWVSSADGNSYSLRDSNGSYGPEDRDNADYTFCLSAGINQATVPGEDGGCGDLPVACCTGGNPVVCDDLGTMSACAALGGVAIPYAMCNANPCPTPANDTCATGRQLICDEAGTGEGTRVHGPPDIGVCAGDPTLVCSTLDANSCINLDQQNVGPCGPPPAPGETYRCTDVVTDNRLATLDGPTSTGGAPPGVLTCLQSGTSSFRGDIWFEYAAECTGQMVINMCGAATYDAMLAVHSDGTGTCICPANNSSMLECNDDYCFGQFSTTSAVAIPVSKDVCYTIRVGGWTDSQGNTGQGISELEIMVACDPLPVVNPAATAPAPHHGPKNRYVSFSPNNGANPVKFKVMRGASQIGWVGTPNAAGLAMVVAADPGLRVWPEVVVHVGDCEIGPVVSDYAIVATDGGVDASPLVVPTIALPSGGKFWGDTVGSFDGVAWGPPNNIVNANDFLAALQKFQNLPQAPHVSWVDVQAVSSIDPCLNYLTNIADVFLLLQAFQGNNYPFASFRTTPATCPTNCNLPP